MVILGNMREICFVVLLGGGMIAACLGVGLKIVYLTMMGALPTIDYFDGFSLILVGSIISIHWLKKILFLGKDK